MNCIFILKIGLKEECGDFSTLECVDLPIRCFRK